MVSGGEALEPFAACRAGDGFPGSGKSMRSSHEKIKMAGVFYCLVLSFFLIKALGFAYTVGNDGSIFIGVGAVLFFLSDLSICFLYFISYKSAGKKLAVHYFNLVTYYISILVLEMGMGYL